MPPSRSFPRISYLPSIRVPGCGKSGCPPKFLIVTGGHSAIRRLAPGGTGGAVRDSDVRCSRVRLADRLPDVEGAKEMYGRSLFHCPYCDGWESRDLPLAVYGSDQGAVGLALGLKTWSGDVVLCAGGGRLASEGEDRLSRNGVSIR